MNLKIWQLDPANLTPYYNMALSEGLAEVGCQVTYITSPFLYDPHLTYPPSIKVVYSYFRGLTHPWLLKSQRLRQILRGVVYPWGHWNVLQALRQNPPDILHIQWNRLPRLDYYFIREVQKLGIPIVQTIHDVVPLYARRSHVPFLERIYAESQAVIVHSQQNQQDLIQRYPQVESKRVHILPHLALTNAFHHETRPPNALRQHLDLPLDKPVFLFLGNFQKYKGLDILLEAFGLALQKNPHIHLLVAGYAQNPSELLASSALQQYPEKISLKLGFVPTDEVGNYHLAADAVILPYRHIYQSGALLTAMGFSRAIIATKVGSFPETIDGNGWLVPPENPAALADAILEAAKDRVLLAKMGERSKEIIQANHSPNRIAQQLMAIYHQICA